MAVDESETSERDEERAQSAAPAETDAAPPGVSPTELAERLAAIESAVAEFHRRSAHRESVIDRLHEENQRLRGGLYRTILDPVVTDLMRMYDALRREADRLTEEGDPAVGRLLESFADDTLLMLERCGLEEFTAQPGDPFEVGRHAAAAVVPVDDEALDNTVAEVVATGFVERETGRVRRPVRARFHRFTPAEPTASESDGAGGGTSDADAVADAS
ncbi:hypothetical protein Arub01_01190 [Actinomadura rubrobrunea]|uniref:Nucleotide exchange factor GrpE n=1 Tax=Actinomadura rubrobrunea TaxID=115335 RepID=A0A9W6PQZ7_9ACTN|nr:nucleotide exchange factor GrpE [Actinomadura rubrobrunea]GLW61875.1 hypothetical protein Arub01_01190 [Actinomadura rubrobrunea]